MAGERPTTARERSPQASGDPGPAPAPPASRRRRLAIRAAAWLAMAVLAAALFAATGVGDASSTLRYAGNVARGDGLVFNGATVLQGVAATATAREAAPPAQRPATRAPGWAVLLGALGAAAPAPAGEDSWTSATGGVLLAATWGSSLGAAAALLAFALPLLRRRGLPADGGAPSRRRGLAVGTALLLVAVLPLLAALAVPLPLSGEAAPWLLRLLASACLPVLGLTLPAVLLLTRPPAGTAAHPATGIAGDSAGEGIGEVGRREAERRAPLGGSWLARHGEMGAGLLVAGAVFLRPDAALAVALGALAGSAAQRRLPTAFLLAALLPLLPWLAWLGGSGVYLPMALVPVPAATQAMATEAAELPLHVRAARHLAEVAPPGAWVAGEAGGILARHLDRPILDLGGEADPQVAAARQSDRLADLLVVREPRYLLVGQRGGRPAGPGARLLMVPAIRDRYRPVAFFTAPAGPGEPAARLTLYERHPLRYDVGIGDHDAEEARTAGRSRGRAQR